MAGLVEEDQKQVLGIDEEEQDQKETEGNVNCKRTHNNNSNRTLVKEKEEGEGGGQGDRDMAPPAGNSIHRSSSRPQLDVSKAEIQGNVEERNPTILLPNQSDDLSHLALDIGGIIMLNAFINIHVSCLLILVM